MKSALSTIIGREYYERVKRKSFIISTLLTPLLMVALMVTPALIAIFSSPDEKKIAVVDESGVIASTLKNNDEVSFIVSDLPLEQLQADEDYFGVLVIGKNILRKPSDVTLYTHGASSMQLEESVASQIKKTVEDIRLRAYNISNLQEILDAINADVKLKTFRIDSDDTSATSSLLSYMTGLIMSLMLYMFILLYGQMVMTSIIEEKNNRVLEIVVSSVRPFDLMLGKIVGVGLVAVTQILIWAAILLSVSLWLMPALAAGMDTAEADPEMLSAMSQLSDGGYMMMLLGYCLLFIIGGYFLYSSIYAAIGSAVDNIQDAGQLQSVAIVPIIMGMVLSPTVVQDPMSTFATWVSVIPFTSPMVMMARIPFGIPAWEIILSIVLLYATALFLIWVAAKIYRVGIFMYGKKPTLAEIIRWTRYK